MASQLECAKLQFNDLPRERLLEMMRQLTWVHEIDFGGGERSPGRWGTGNPDLMKAFDAIDFRGRKVLDIGCWDGRYSFLAEERGAAEVYSTDLISQRDFQESPTYQIAHALRQSKAKYFPNLSVYNVEQLGIRDFDVVLYMGVFYHLKDPVRSLSCLRRVMREGGLAVVEGAISNEPGCFARFYYREAAAQDLSNWWMPTHECLRQWVECSFMEIKDDFGIWGLHPGGWPRSTLLARAVVKNDPLYSRVPEDLEEFSLPA